MKVNVDINRTDLVWMNLYVAYKAPSNVSFVLFIWFGMSGMYFYKKGLSQPASQIAEQLLHNAGIALAVAIAMILLSIFLTVLSSTRKAGVLGDHEYNLKDDGLLEITDANETLVKWSSIKSILKSKRFILVQINWYLFHTLPSRCFSSTDEFEEFYTKIQQRVNASNNAN